MKKLFKTLSFGLLVTTTAVFAQYNNMPSSATDYGNPPTQMNNTPDQASDYSNPPAPGSMNNNIPDDASDYGNQPVADQDVYDEQSGTQRYTDLGAEVEDDTDISEADKRADELQDSNVNQTNQEFSE
ncbi:MAG: hypothetical protein CME62_12290 [Halobacteriovoraceae bacterium]|nr:hypothetical protein [Halobacteriovoraceae bacterium]|tara:strand:- start:4019 stop:4402 length:384 start_codon:yes stop_codon:yes gene_type:complete